jgi:hypothetical protein
VDTGGFDHLGDAHPGIAEKASEANLFGAVIRELAQGDRLSRRDPTQQMRAPF